MGRIVNLGKEDNINFDYSEYPNLIRTIIKDAVPLYSSFTTVLSIAGEGYINSVIAAAYNVNQTVNLGLRITADGVVVLNTDHSQSNQEVSGIVNSEVFKLVQIGISTVGYYGFFVDGIGGDTNTGALGNALTQALHQIRGSATSGPYLSPYSAPNVVFKVPSPIKFKNSLIIEVKNNYANKTSLIITGGYK